MNTSTSGKTDFAKRAKEDYEVSTVRAGLNRHIGGGYEPLK